LGCGLAAVEGLALPDADDVLKRFSNGFFWFFPLEKVGIKREM
jgi:hypothetical protein